MESFLEGCRAALQDHVQSKRAVHVVLGNEACDLDSMVSALVLAYFLAKTTPDAKAAFVPVLNIPRADFPLRTESTCLLRQQHIPETVLVFRDEIDLAGLHKAGLLSVTLVDHHVLPSKDAALEDSVVEVLDHRPLEWERAPPCRVTAEPVGSCATLVAERILQAQAPTLDPQGAALLHGTILLDCVNMAPEAGKGTPKDAHCVARLEALFPALGPRNLVFDTLQRAKFDVSGLTTEQMLRKDLKTLVSRKATVGLSVVYLPLQDFLYRPRLEQDLAAFCHQRNFGLLIAMTISFGDHGRPFRQLAVYSEEAELREAVCQALVHSINPLLGLSRLESPCPPVRAYQQNNTVASRKKVLPIVREFLHQWANPRSSMQPEISRCSQPTRADSQDAPQDGPKPDRPHEETADEDTALPPTPMNSLVDECPLQKGLPQVSPEAILERVSRIATDRSASGRPREQK